jgi:hypothetical protein
MFGHKSFECLENDVIGQRCAQIAHDKEENVKEPTHENVPKIGESF